MKIAFLTIATNKYINFIPGLAKSIDTFCDFDNMTLFVFGNQPVQVENITKLNIEGHYITHTPHPLGTILRYHYYMEIKDKLKEYDYVFHIDSDMKIVSRIGKEILGNLVCVQHPGSFFWENDTSKFTYDRNPESGAYVALDDPNQQQYYQNCFQGASSEQFIKMSETIKGWFEKDIKKNYVALWHDESYMNKYMIINQPDVVLHPGYAYPETWKMPVEAKIIHLHKDHNEIRK